MSHLGNKQIMKHVSYNIVGLPFILIQVGVVLVIINSVIDKNKQSTNLHYRQALDSMNQTAKFLEHSFVIHSCIQGT